MGGEFENSQFKVFCDEIDISHNFSCPRTPRQNPVVERNNKTLKEMARTILNDFDIHKYFYVKAINTSCYILNKISIKGLLNKTPYELWKWRMSNIPYFNIFGCECYLLNNIDNSGRFDEKID